MPRLANHGAGCCGVRHLYSFNGPAYLNGRGFVNNTVDDINALLAPFGVTSGGRSRGKCIEAVITDSQFQHMPDLAKTMKDCGFKLVSRFYNSSGGMCNVLHRVSGGRDINRAAARNPHIRTLIS